MARPTGVGRALATYEIPIEGRDSADTIQLSVRIVGLTESRLLDRVSDIA